MRARLDSSAVPKKKGGPQYELSPRSSSHESGAIVLCATAIFLTVCLLSYDLRDPSFNVATTRAHVSNLGGLVGSYVADTFVRLLGFSAFLVPLSLLFVALRLFLPPTAPLRWNDPLNVFALVIGIAVLFDRSGWNPVPLWALSHPGGAVGAFFHAAFFKLFGRVGEVILVLTLMVLNTLYLARVSPRNCLRIVRDRAYSCGTRVGDLFSRLRDAYRARRHAPRTLPGRYVPEGPDAWAPRSAPASALDQQAPASQRLAVDFDDIQSQVPWERVRLVKRAPAPAAVPPAPSSPEPHTTRSEEPQHRSIRIRPPVVSVPREAADLYDYDEDLAENPDEPDDYVLGADTPDSIETDDEFDYEPPSVRHTPTEVVEPPVHASLTADAQPKVPATSTPETTRRPHVADKAEPPLPSPVSTDGAQVSALPTDCRVLEDLGVSPSQAHQATTTRPEKSTRPDPQTRTVVRDQQQALEEAIEEYLREGLAEMPDEELEDESIDVMESVSQDEELHPVMVAKRGDEDVPAHSVTRKGRSGAPDDEFMLPPTSLLDAAATEDRSVDVNLLETNAAILEQKLCDLGIRGQVVEIHPGPVITMYELTLAPGVPLRRVLNTSDDLAMALKSGSTRIVAPIPGKDTVGIEVPNLNREMVHFREIVESPAFMDLKNPLKIALGKCTDGQPFATSLARMPHLLIAGATGTGKSVGLNCIICSWLMSCHPDDLKLIMVDPKKLELSYYQDIPHLIHPVVTDPDKVPRVLSWAIREMERRYELLSKVGARSIEGYNKKMAAARAECDLDEEFPAKIPYLVIVVDELAELMMVAAKDIEISIARLAQMARAAGIHLILATQRPSVDVITGVIKANLPARISFQVSARPDSRTILDTTGAENLLGMGDMLFLPPGTSKMVRVHGSFVSENEITRITDFIRAQRAPNYLKEIENHVAEQDSKGPSADAIEDSKYDDAIELVTRLGHASISLIQRHMRIGYNRAARIIESMEAEGIIGPSDGTSRPREVLARSLHSIPDQP